MASNTLHMSFSIAMTTLFIFLIKLSNSQMVPAIFVFGDSLVDVGNNNHLPMSIAKANFPHHGVDFPTKKPTGRFSNGKNVADLLAQKLGLPTSPPYLSLSPINTTSLITGVSFASAGSGIFNGSDQILGQAIPLNQQVSYYEVVYGVLVGKMGYGGAQNHISESLFFVVEGNNDLFDYSKSSNLQTKYTPQQYVDLMSTTLKSFLERLYASSARKFVFAGIGPLGCIPLKRAKNKSQECDEQFNSFAVLYNQRLKAMLRELESELTGFSYSYFDTYSTFQKIIQNASNYGFTEIKAACCGIGKLNAEFPCAPISALCPNRRDHLFWDLTHPTEAADTILVDSIFDGPLDVSFPVNVRHLVAA